MEKTTWLERLSAALDRHAGEHAREQVLQGSEGLSSGSSPGTKARWVCGMIERLERLAGEESGARIMAECHCSYRQSDIQRLKGIYETSHRIDDLVEELQQNRREELHRRLNAREDLWAKAQEQPFFTTPVRTGRTLIHITPPYHPQTYLEETEFAKKRAHYCHCGWINGSKTSVSKTFCHCGTGFYRSLWEGVLGVPVEVEVVCTVFQGAEDCRVRVTLPEGIGLQD